MHQDFADWFRPVRITTSKDLLEARHAAAVAIGPASRKRGSDALALVASAFGDGPPAFPTWLTGAMKKADPTLLLHDNDHELRVIAASGLALMLEDRRYECGAIANAVRCASLMGARRPSVEIPLSRLADDALRHWASERRRTKDVARPQAQKLDRRKLEPALVAVASGTGWAAPADAMRALADAVDAAMTAMATAAADGMQELEAQLEALREESALVWWAVGGRSRTMGRPLGDMDGAEVPLIVGMEISRYVVLQPSPTSLLAVLGRALLHRDASRRTAHPLGEAVDRLSSAQRATWLANVPEGRFGAVAPITEAIARAERNGAAWRSGFERAAGLDPNLPIEPELMALQACEEHLLPAQFP